MEEDDQKLHVRLVGVTDDVDMTQPLRDGLLQPALSQASRYRALRLNMGSTPTSFGNG